DVGTSVHSNRLNENLSNVDQPAAQTVSAISRGLAGHGFEPALANEAAQVVLGHLVARESTVLAFQDVFILTAIFGIPVALLSFGLPKARGLKPAKPAQATPSIFTPVNPAV